MADPPAWQPHIGPKSRAKALAKRAKNPKDPLKLVIVRDMWLTGFDAPSMHTMYVDKPMKGHGLMQAIARVNRVFANKQAGLVVDYIGIAQNLKTALGQYSGADQRQVGIDDAEAVAEMLERHEVVRAMYHGFDYESALAGSGHDRLVALAGAIEWYWITSTGRRRTRRPRTASAPRTAAIRTRFWGLSKAFALASGTDAAREIRDDVGFFQTGTRGAGQIGGSRRRVGQEPGIRDPADSRPRRHFHRDRRYPGCGRDHHAGHLYSVADEFLAEIQQLEKKNLALEALRKLLNDEIRSRSKTNLVETRRFPNGWKAPSRAITTTRSAPSRC